MKIKLHNFYIILIFIFLCLSCNVSRYYQKKTGRAYSNFGTRYWIDELDSATIHWRKVGGGEDKILLLHGFGPLTELQWQEVAKELISDFTLFIPDLIYFGMSSSDSKKYSPSFISNQLYRSLKKELDGPFYVGGVSYGGLIAGIMAHEHPEDISGLILIDALSKHMNRDKTDSLAAAYGYKSISEILVPTDGKSLKKLFQISFHRPKKYPTFLLEKPAKDLYSYQSDQKKGLLEYLDIHQQEIIDQDFNYSGPVQIIWGEKDILIPVSAAIKLRNMYPSSSLSVLPETGHVAHMERPGEVAEIIRGFVIKQK